jgi:flagellar biosynthesis/type III secretory pathway protein FliH
VLPADQKRLYSDAILTELPFELREILEDRMQRHKYEDQAAQRHDAQGLEAGRAKGRSEGREQGRDEGRTDGLRAAVLAFARARLAPLSSEDAAAIGELREESELTELVDTLAQAATVEDARAVLDAAIAGTRK